MRLCYFISLYLKLFGLSLAKSTLELYISDFAVICAKNGFLFEQHTVLTADGYKLT